MASDAPNPGGTPTPQTPKPVAAPAPVAPKPAAAVPKMAASAVPKAPAAKAPAPASKPAAVPKPASKPPAPEFQLPPAVYSPAMLESVIYDIQYYLDWVRQNNIRKKVGAAPKEEPTHSAETVLVIEAWLAGKPATMESLEALLGYLHDVDLPEIHLMLAALPNRSQRENLVTWFRTNVSPHLLVSFVADRNLGGGIVVRTPNRVFDYTWKAQLTNGRAKLAEIIRSV